MVERSEVDGRITTFSRRQGRGPTLVCHHGSADNHHVYDRLLDALPDRGSIAVNAPGRAGTDGPPLSSVAEMEGHLARFVDSEVEGDYVVVGHSLGGGVAIEHALTSAPDRLRGVVLLATGARLRVHPMILQLFEQISKTGKLPPLPLSVFEPGVDPALTKEASTYRELTPIETGGADWRAANAFDRMPDLGRLEVPALIIAGTEDALTPPKYAEYMHAHIPQSELWVIEGAGHMFLMERANEVAKAINHFIAERRL